MFKTKYLIIVFLQHILTNIWSEEETCYAVIIIIKLSEDKMSPSFTVLFIPYLFSYKFN